MATEKITKAAVGAITGMPAKHSHVAFSQLEHFLRRRDVARALGYARYPTYVDVLKRTAPLRRQIEQLHPQVTTGPDEGPNVEYPWEGRDAEGRAVWYVPAAHHFGLLPTLRQTPDGRSLLAFLERLITRFDALERLGS